MPTIVLRLFAGQDAGQTDKAGLYKALWRAL